MAPAAGTGSMADRELCNLHDGLLPPLQAEGPCLAVGAAVPLPEHDLCLAKPSMRRFWNEEKVMTLT